MNTKYRRTLIAHELGHAIAGYLFEPNVRPATIHLVPAGDGSLASCSFYEYEGDFQMGDGRLSRIKNMSYLGGIFGELLIRDRTYLLGIRGDLDEFLCENRYPRKSRSKIVNELFAWFYTDKDDWSFGGRMKLYFDCPRGFSGTYMHESRLKKRLPETWKAYQKFLKCIDQDKFIDAVDKINSSGSKYVQTRSIQKYGKQIITAISEDNII